MTVRPARLRRHVVEHPVELRASGDGVGRLYGHGAVFDRPTKLYGSWEQFAPGAFDDVLDADDTDVRALWGHDRMSLLGRQSAGTLEIRIDDIGLWYEVELPDVSYARDLAELVRRRDVTGSSIGFWPADEEASKHDDGATLWTVTRVESLRDVAPVTFPAYGDTDAALRDDAATVTNRSRLIRARHRARRQ